jgi:hypothetical protein
MIHDTKNIHAYIILKNIQLSSIPLTWKIFGSDVHPKTQKEKRLCEENIWLVAHFHTCYDTQSATWNLKFEA